MVSCGVYISLFMLNIWRSVTGLVNWLNLRSITRYRAMFASSHRPWHISRWNCFGIFRILRIHPYYISTHTVYPTYSLFHIVIYINYERIRMFFYPNLVFVNLDYCYLGYLTKLCWVPSTWVDTISSIAAQ